MKTIRMTGWRRGLQKVSLTQAPQKTGLGLKRANFCTERLLDGEVVEVLVDEPDAEDLLLPMREFGVNDELAEVPPNNRTPPSRLSPEH